MAYLEPELVTTVDVVIVTGTIVVEGVLVVTGADTGELIVDIEHLGAAASEVAGAVVSAPP